MMRYELSDAAIEDIVTILAYIASDSESAAERLHSKLTAKFKLLAQQPGLGRPREEFMRKDLRISQLGNYLIFYVAQDYDIRVARIVHGARDLWALLDEDD